jgi:hypothetical protein
MRRRFPILVLALTTLLLAPLPLRAKEKKMPAPDWALEAAKTPTPQSAGEAPAVVLFDEYQITVDAQNHATERERIAVRILKPQGREYSHCSISYDTDEKLNSFHAWTIAADGRQFQAMDTDFSDHGDYGDSIMQFTEQTRTVKPPASDPGAVVACETEQQLRPYMNFESWDIQATIPVVHQALDLFLPPGGHYADFWRNYKPVLPVEVQANHLRWVVDNMPRLDFENLHAVPAWGSQTARMSLFWGDEAARDKDTQWRKIGLWGQKLQEHRTDPSPEITTKVQELVAGAPDLYTKLSRITAYIQNNVKYFIVMHGIGGWQSHYAADIFRTHSGDCKDKATLLISMLQVIGVRAYYFHVDSRRGIIDPGAPSLSGNHMIAAIELPAAESDPRLAARVKTPSGKNLLIFDPTDEETPVGLIRTQLQGAWGNIFDGEDSRALLMPVLAPTTAGLQRNGSFTLSAEGDLSGDIAFSYTGPDASSERSFLKDSDDKEIRRSLEAGFGSNLPGLAFKGYEFHQTADLDKPLGLDLHFSVPGYAHSAGPLLLVRPRVLGSDAHNVPDVQEGKPRKYAIVLGHPGRWHDSYQIALPAGYKIDEAPDPVKLDVGFASYASSVSARDNKLFYEREYVVRDVEIPPGKASDFRKLQEAILSDESSAVVLKKQ